MKSSRIILAVCLAAVLLLCGCGQSGKEADLQEGMYVEQSGEVSGSSLYFCFYPQEQTFRYGGIAVSYFVSGSYTLGEGTITAVTEDGENTYIFRLIDDETIAFVSEGSSEIYSLSTSSLIEDGALFKLLDHGG